MESLTDIATSARRIVGGIGLTAASRLPMKKSTKSGSWCQTARRLRSFPDIPSSRKPRELGHPALVDLRHPERRRSSADRRILRGSHHTATQEVHSQLHPDVIPRQLPRPAGESAGLRDDAVYQGPVEC